jgi:hypothetical protein
MKAFFSSMLVQSIVISASILSGCQIQDTTKEAQQVNLQWKMPVLTALPQTKPSQGKGGILISLAPVSYNAARLTKTVDTPYRPFLADENTRYFNRSEIPHSVVEPSNLRFSLTISNKLDRVFRGAGSVVSLNVNNNALAVNQSGYESLLNLIVTPRGQAQVDINGPELKTLPDSCTIALFIYDVVTDVDAAGNPTKKENFEWYFKYSTETKTEVGSYETKSMQQKIN